MDALDVAITWIDRIAKERGIQSITMDTPRTQRNDVTSSLPAIDPLNDIDTITFKFNPPSA